MDLLRKFKDKYGEKKKVEIKPHIAAAPAIQEVDSREQQLDNDIDEPSETRKIVVAPAIESHQCAWTNAGNETCKKETQGNLTQFDIRNYWRWNLIELKFISSETINVFSSVRSKTFQNLFCYRVPFCNQIL